MPVMVVPVVLDRGGGLDGRASPGGRGPYIENISRFQYWEYFFE